MSIDIVQGSILDFEGDAIVNPANSFLRHGGGLAKVIADAAIGEVGYDRSESLAGSIHGPQDIPWTKLGADWRREQEQYELIATGSAGITTAGHLPYEAIIHAVGPIWGGGGLYEERLLRRAHEAAYVIAARLGYDSIAYPAISCGIYGFPVALAAPNAIESIQRCQTHDLVDVTFYLFEDEHYEAYREALERV